MFDQDVLEKRLTVEMSDSALGAPDFANDVLVGFSASPKRMLPMYLYDERGSQLFEEICELPEYYITRTERNILERYAHDIVSCSEGNMGLVELGSGSSFKTRILIEAFIDLQGHLHYFPVDISPSILIESAHALLKEYSDLEISAHVAEYNDGIHRIAEEDFEQKMVVFLGSNIGNFEPDEAESFLSKIRDELTDRDYLLLGTDMQKDMTVLEAAYNDAQGITAAFNRNLLHRINEELGGHFNIEDFQHTAIYNHEEHRIEMHLNSTKKQSVFIDKLNRAFEFQKGETIHTENSYKFNLERISRLSRKSGFRVIKRWQDSQRYFSLNLLAPID